MPPSLRARAQRIAVAGLLLMGLFHVAAAPSAPHSSAAAPTPAPAASSAPDRPATAKTAAAPLAIESLFAPAEWDHLVLSPDGRRVAGTLPRNGQRQLVVLDLLDRRAMILTALQQSDVIQVRWLSDQRLVYATGSARDAEAAMPTGLHAIDRDGRDARTLGGAPARGLQLVQRTLRLMPGTPARGDEVLVLANERSEQSLDVYRVDTHTGRKTLLTPTSPGHVIEWVLDASQQPRAALSMDPRTNRWWSSYRPPGSQEWQVIAAWDAGLRDVVIPVAVDPEDDRRLIVRSNVGRDTLALFRHDPVARQLGELIAGSDRHDVGSFRLLAPSGEHGELLRAADAPHGPIAGVRWRAERLTTRWFDPTARRAQTAVDEALPGRVNVFDATASRALVLSSAGDEPGRWFLFDRERLTLQDLQLSRAPRLDGAALARPRAVSFTARDGLPISAYLTRPTGVPEGTPAPLVLLPHGGPWSRTTDGFDPEVQFFASRGFVVLQPDFRGSTGYGATHLRAGFAQWGGAMTDDLLDALDWAVRSGVADPARVGVFGASYGGFAALSVLVKRPDAFRWGVNYAGAVDLALHQDTQPAQLRGSFGALARRLHGDRDADADAFERQSPLRHVARINAPVLHAYGGQDTAVDFAHGRAIREAFERAGKAHEWIFAGDEGHGFSQPANVHAFYRRVEDFIARHTAPRSD